MLLLLSADFKIIFFKTILSGTLSEGQTGWIQTVSPDLGPNCLQRLSAEDKTRHQQRKS